MSGISENSRRTVAPPVNHERGAAAAACDRAQHQLRQQVAALLTATNGAHHGPVRASVPWPHTDPAHWLKAQGPQTRIYWADRENHRTVAGLGEADVAFAAASASLRELAGHLGPMLSACPDGTRYYGGMRFDPVPAAETSWQPFGAYRFVLPRFELHAGGQGCMLHCNLIPARDRAQRDEVFRMIGALAVPNGPLPRPVPAPVRRVNRPDRTDWYAMVSWALKTFNGKGLQKVVLAREACFAFAEPPEPVDLLVHLAAGTPSCFHFLFQPPGGPAFVGASPERLFRRRGRNIESEAVAGTRPRGASASDDARLLDELLHSDKERREHEFVRMSLREELQPLATRFDLDEQPSEMKLANDRHLVSRVRATLRSGVTSLDVLDALHPTPAAGGYPTQAALRAIKEQEPFDRGWYAGPVGWIGRNEADFAVGIRSGLVHGRQLSLYSGAGIVLGSTPGAEWAEIEHKLGGFTRVLGITPSDANLHRAPQPAIVAGTAS